MLFAITVQPSLEFLEAHELIAVSKIPAQMQRCPRPRPTAQSAYLHKNVSSTFPPANASGSSHDSRIPRVLFQLPIATESVGPTDKEFFGQRSRKRNSGPNAATFKTIMMPAKRYMPINSPIPTCMPRIAVNQGNRVFLGQIKNG